MQTTSIENVSNEYGEWKNTLGFYKDELGIFKNRLTEIAKKNTGDETMQMVEHFENQFLIQTENIDTLRHDIKKHLNLIAKELQENEGLIDKNQLTLQYMLKDRFENEQNIYNGIKDEFIQFERKIM